jgi:hypothetical protein
VQIVATNIYSRKVNKLLTRTGGVRKARAARGSSGKSGGVRIIYYYRSSRGKLFLLTVYAKSHQADLSAADKKSLRQIVKSIEGT